MDSIRSKGWALSYGSGRWFARKHIDMLSGEQMVVNNWGMLPDKYLKLRYDSGNGKLMSNFGSMVVNDMKELGLAIELFKSNYKSQGGISNSYNAIL
jgi:hypothetical protein